MSQQLLFSLLLVSFASSNATIYLPKGLKNDQIKQAPKEVAWDIHNVLAQKDGGAKAKAVLPNIFTVAWTKLFGNDAWDQIDRLPKNSSGQAHEQIFLKHGQKKLAKIVRKAANAYKPRKGMEQIVKEIHQQKIVQRLASNIGQEFLANLDAKFKKKYNCTVFNYIQPGKIVDYSKYGKTITNAVKKLGSHQTAYPKPDPKFYQDYNAVYKKNNSHIVFIDDDMDNVRAAVRAGWVGIHFDINRKDPVVQLRKDLQDLGIINKKQ